MWSNVFTRPFMPLAIVTTAVAATHSVEAQAQGTALEVVTSFDNPTQNGSTPAATLVQASDGSPGGTAAKRWTSSSRQPTTVRA